MVSLLTWLRSRRRPEPPRIITDPAGFDVIWPSGERQSVRWAQVIRVLAYKRDHLTTDEVLVAFRQAEDPRLVVQVSEEWPGFRNLFEPMARELAVSDAWYLETTKRPFASDFRTLYEREGWAGVAAS
jgi:hypothetical protein